MPEYLRSLVVILVFSTVVFVFAKGFVCPGAVSPVAFNFRRKLWFAITLIAFLSHSYLLFLIVTAITLSVAIKRETNRLALYFAIMFAVPSIPYELEVGGAIRYLFTIDYLRLLSMVILLPTYLAIKKARSAPRFGSLLPDKVLLTYLFIQLVLYLKASTLIQGLRIGFLYPFLGVFLPYYVASRSMTAVRDFRDALAAYVIAALIMSSIGFFEFLRHWLLYTSVESTLGVDWALTGYLARGSDLRAQASMGQPIPLGYALAIGIGYWYFVVRSSATKSRNAGSLALLGLGILSPLSRGPWVGTAAGFIVYTITGSRSMSRLLKVAMVGAAIAPLIFLTPLGDKVINYLPWVGGAETKTVDYRSELLTQSILVIKRNPLFGAPNFMAAPELQQLATGAGFIDIVSTYIGIALAQGLISLAVFVGIFVSVAYLVFSAMRGTADKESERHQLGRVLLGNLVCTAIVIGTVSSISVIPVIYWSLLGLGVAYVEMCRRGEVDAGDVTKGMPRASAGSTKRSLPRPWMPPQ
ncbi:MAG TPA: O-antigen ligase family protein [Nitrospira sp.]|nr:O-antigen ligase family protein [Nitrospira sp.]